MKKNIFKKVLYLVIVFTVILSITGAFTEPKNVLAYDDYVYDYDSEDFDWGYDDDYTSKSYSPSAAEIRRQNRLRKSNIKYVIIFIVVIGIYGVIFKLDIEENGMGIKFEKKPKSQVNYNYYKELPRKGATPLEALTIYNKYLYGIESMNVGNIFSATILEMQQRGVLEFEIDPLNTGNDRLKINLKENYWVLNVEEREAYDLLKNVSKEYSEITVKTISEYVGKNNTEILTMLQTFNSTSMEKMLRNGIVNKLEEKKGTHGFYIGASAFGIFLFISLFFTTIGESSLIFLPFLYVIPFFISIARLVIGIINDSIEKRNFERFTQKGLNEYEEWHAFARYMSNFSAFKEDKMELSTLEKYLPYATSLGIAKQVLNQAKIVYPDYNNDNGRFYGNLYAADILTSQEFQNSIISAYNRGVSSRFSSNSSNQE